MGDRVEALMAAARASGLTMDVLYELTCGLSDQAFHKVMGNASAMPSYMKSSDSPYVRRSDTAPSSEMRDLPPSQLEN